MTERAAMYLAAGGAITRRDFALFVSYRMQVVTMLFGVVFQLALFYYLSRFVSVGGFTPETYFAFAVIGLASLQVIQSTFDLSTTVRQELVARSFERILMSPFGPTAAMISMLGFPLLMAMVMATLTVCIAGVLFGVAIAWSTAPLALPVAALGALAFAPFGVFFAAITVVFKQAPGRAWVMSLIALAAGVYFPTHVLPDWLRWLSEVQPLTPALDLTRHLLVGLPLTDPAWLSLLKMGGFVTVMLPLSCWTMGAAVRVARRRGTIIEY